MLRNGLIDAWERAGRPASGAPAGEGEIVGRQADGTVVPRYHIQSPAVGFEGAGPGRYSRTRPHPSPGEA